MVGPQKKLDQKKKKEIISYPDIPIRDVIDLMEFPFLALSKDRINPITYESEDKTQELKSVVIEDILLRASMTGTSSWLLLEKYRKF